MMPRRTLILFHILSLALFLGAAAACVVVEQPQALQPIIYRLLLPALGLSIISGCLLLMIAESALLARWFWLKSALVTALLIVVMVYLLPAVNDAVEQSVATADAGLGALGWITVLLTVAVVVLGVIRPRLGQRGGQ